MELNVLKSVERKKNLMMFVVNIMVPIAGFAFVMLFLHSTIRDSVVLLIAIGYYDISVLKVNAVVTIVSNVIGMILFPQAFLEMHSWTVQMKL